MGGWKQSHSPPFRENYMSSNQNLKTKLDQQKKRDRELVKGVFKNFEAPGAPLRFSFKKYKDDQVQSYEFYDNHIYTIPRMVAMHLNNNCWYPEYEYLKGEDKTKDIYGVKKKVKRYGFQSLEFMDLEDQQPEANQQMIVEAVKL